MRHLFSPLALAGALLLAPARAEWKPEYAAAPLEVQQWYATREMTEETRARLGVGWRSCCKHSDVVKTKFFVDKQTGGDVWFWFDEKQEAETGYGWRRIPEDTVHQGEHAPSGQPTLFVYKGIETCFFPGESGN
jgi:hypothetical protein